MQRFIRSGIRAAERVSPRLSAHLALTLIRIPFSAPRPTREVVQLDQAVRHSYLSSKGRHNPYWTFGEGPVVILCHGWQGRGSQLATLAMAIADAGYQAVVFDHTAHGDAPGRVSDFRTVGEDILALTREFDAIHAIAGFHGRHDVYVHPALWCECKSLRCHGFALCTFSYSQKDGGYPGCVT